MGHTLYLECNSGISGDMTVAALLDLGADENVLRAALNSMSISGFEVEISRVKKAGLDVCDFCVKLDHEHENHDHDMEYLHGHEHNGEYQHEHSHKHNHECQHEHSHEHNHEHNHECQYEHNHQHQYECQHEYSHKHNHEYQHEHSHEHQHEHNHQHEHSSLPYIQDIITNADMTERAKSLALKIFDILAQAEAKAHGVDISEVHFHEVGAVDSIVDIVATAVCIDNLDITEVIVPYLCEGIGTVRCQHGILPIPVPATANIVQMNGLTLQITGTRGELVTPTGAAITAAIRTKDSLPESFIIQKIGMGAGKRNYERPSILRAMIIEQSDSKKADEIFKLETNIDDCTGEMLGYVLERLFKYGAKDVYYTPVFMKKNRPAYKLTVLCDEGVVKQLENIIFKETTTIGIRKYKVRRTVLEREMGTEKLSIGEIKVKKCILPDGTVKKYPEYETLAELAKESGKSFSEVMDICKREL